MLVHRARVFDRSSGLLKRVLVLRGRVSDRWFWVVWRLLCWKYWDEEWQDSDGEYVVV